MSGSTLGYLLHGYFFVKFFQSSDKYMYSSDIRGEFDYMKNMQKQRYRITPIDGSLDIRGTCCALWKMPIDDHVFNDNQQVSRKQHRRGGWS